MNNPRECGHNLSRQHNKYRLLNQLKTKILPLIAERHIEVGHLFERRLKGFTSQPISLGYIRTAENHSYNFETRIDIFEKSISQNSILVR